MSALVLRAEGLRHAYGSLPVLRGADIAITAGECVVLQGPNGAGKTTLIRILATLLRPSAGSLTIGGVDALRDSPRTRALLGLAGDRTLLCADLTARENLRFYGNLYGVQRLDHAIGLALGHLDVVGLADRPVRTLSKGMQQRVSLARAILHDPLLLLLDEPETALDEDAQRRLSALLVDRSSRGLGTLLVSHRLEWAGAAVSRIVQLQGGRIEATAMAGQA